MTDTASAHSWVMRPRPNPEAHLRLFCLPYAGAGASVFRTWPDDLPPEIEVCSIQLPGREDRIREAPLTRFPLLVNALAKAIRSYLDRPFALFGHSMGALISFELTHLLHQEYRLGPVHLLVSGHRAPQLPLPRSPIHQLPDAALMEKLRQLQGNRDSALQNPELMEIMRPTIRADFAVCETYVYGPKDPLQCPISAFGGVQDAEIHPEELAAWRDHTRSAFTLRMVPGDHFFLHSARPLLLQAIAADLKSSMPTRSVAR